MIADRTGSASDAVLTVYKVTKDAAGAEVSKQVLELDDQPEPPTPPRWQLASRDPGGLFTPDETATYRVLVTDRFRSHRAYRLIARAAVPDFAVVALPDSPANEDKKLFKWQPNLRRGGSAPFPVAVLRRGYDGEIILRAEGLPEGVTASGAIPANAPTGLLIFRASNEAKPWCGAVRVIAEGGGVAREVQAIAHRWNVDNRDNIRVGARLGSMALGVADEVAPLTIAPAEPKVWEAVIGSDLEIPIKLVRGNPDAQPKGPWQVALYGLTGLVKWEPVTLDAGTANDGKLALHFQNKDGNSFKPGTYTVWLRGTGVVAYKADAKDKLRDLKHIEFSEPFSLKLNEAPAAAAGK